MFGHIQELGVRCDIVNDFYLISAADVIRMTGFRALESSSEFKRQRKNQALVIEDSDGTPWLTILGTIYFCGMRPLYKTYELLRLIIFRTDQDTRQPSYYGPPISLVDQTISHVLQLNTALLYTLNVMAKTDADREVVLHAIKYGTLKSNKKGTSPVSERVASLLQELQE